MNEQNIAPSAGVGEKSDYRVEYTESEQAACHRGWGHKVLDAVKGFFSKERQPKAEAAAETETDAENLVAEDNNEANGQELSPYDELYSEMEKESLAQDMVKARDLLDSRKRQRFERQRIQEIVERNLNSKLLTVEELEDESVLGDKGVEKHTVTYEESEIPVFDLKGAPFAMLTTTIDFRRFNKPGDIGTETSRAVMDDPSIWAQRRDEAEQTSGFGTENADARGDTISCSYTNSEKNRTSKVPGELVYGFGKVTGDSIIGIYGGDAGTVNMAGTSETKLWDTNGIKNLEGPQQSHGYNEILLRRYSEDGAAKRPDYIVVDGAEIPEVALRHAKFFGIPIVRIEGSAYREKEKARKEELMDQILQEEDYIKMDQQISELYSMSEAPHQSLRDLIGRERSTVRQEDAKELDVVEVEEAKRLAFIKETLEKEIERLSEATEGGEVLPGGAQPTQFESFSVSLADAASGVRHATSGDYSYEYTAPGNCNRIFIDFQIKDSQRHVKTEIVDWQRPVRLEEAPDHASLQYQIEKYDSSAYDELAPVVMRYIEEYRKNQGLQSEQAA